MGGLRRHLNRQGRLHGTEALGPFAFNERCMAASPATHDHARPPFEVTCAAKSPHKVFSVIRHGGQKSGPPSVFGLRSAAVPVKR